MSLTSNKERRAKPFFLPANSRPSNFGQILETTDLRPGQFVYFHEGSDISVVLILGMTKYKIKYSVWSVDQIINAEIHEASACELGLEPYPDGIWGKSYLQKSTWPDMSEKDVEFIMSNIENHLRTIME